MMTSTFMSGLPRSAAPQARAGQSVRIEIAPLGSLSHTLVAEAA